MFFLALRLSLSMFENTNVSNFNLKSYCCIFNMSLIFILLLINCVKCYFWAQLGLHDMFLEIIHHCVVFFHWPSKPWKLELKSFIILPFKTNETNFKS